MPIRSRTVFSLNAFDEYNGFMSRRQYTVRNIPEPVDRELRKRARQENKSLNAVILEILQEACGLQQESAVHHDLDHLIGTWVEDPEFDRVMQEFERIASF